MIDNTNNLLKNVIQETDKLINDIIRHNDEDVINTYKDTLLNKWKGLYTMFSQDISNTEFNVRLPSCKATKNVTNTLITQHLLKNDDHKIASMIPNSSSTIEDYLLYKNIEKGIKENNLEPLKNLLDDCDFTSEKLEFLYHALTYLLLLKNTSNKEALMYAKINFRENFLCEIRKILFVCFFKSKLSHTIILYRKKVMQQLYEDFSLIKNLPQFNALEMLIKAGSDSVDKLVRASDVFEQYNINYQSGGELPIDLEVPVKYHSLFICPVIKMFCGKNNPPTRLNCGHVISRNAVERISKDNQFAVFKCPYCPHDCKMCDVKELKL